MVVIAVGNPYRRDDGAGAVVLERLAPLLRDLPGATGATGARGAVGVRLAELDGEPVRVVQTWEGSAIAWVVDAVRSGAAPGTIHDVAPDRVGELGGARGARLAGGHALGLGEAVELGRALDRMPATLHVLGIEGADFDDGVGLSPEVDEACTAVAARIAAAIAAETAPETAPETAARVVAGVVAGVELAPGTQ